MGADTWWDTKERCIVAKANAELEDLINQDVDLMFLEDAIMVDLTQVQDTQADVEMSTGSISTFCTTATPQVKVGVRPSNKWDSTTTAQETSADQASVLMGISMLEVDFNAFMKHVTETLQISPSHLKSPPGGLQTRKPP